MNITKHIPYIIIFIMTFVLTSIIISDINISSKISINEFNKIQLGMTYEEIIKIVGQNGTLT